MRPSERKKPEFVPDNFRFVSLDKGGDIDFSEVISGLKKTPKSVSPKFLYDARGSELFQLICTTDAYYPTRTERDIYQRRATAIAAEVGPDTIVIEFGPGDMSKVRLLLEVLRPQTYIGVDVSAAQLEDAGRALAADFLWLEVLAICGDFGPSAMLEKYLPSSGQRVAFFPGSTIGNFDPDAARQFLQGMREMLGSGGVVIVGVDLQKPAIVLDGAYNDPEGYTRAFNLNLLTRLNRELGSNFDERRFRHKAYYSERLGRVEMHLVSVIEQQVRIGEHTISFQPGETIHTESSWKYTQDGFTKLAIQAGFKVKRFLTDEQSWFGVFILLAN
ncbi:MAG: L-histidine N(alpha)-methyltransferase [Burkholderiales bacterium]|nr:L-histidine N(alpha)-methyltransferase [Burkholderiales bacterium]